MEYIVYVEIMEMMALQVVMEPVVLVVMEVEVVMMPVVEERMVLLVVRRMKYIMAHLYKIMNHEKKIYIFYMNMYESSVFKLSNILFIISIKL